VQFSGYQWFYVIALDILVRAALFVLFSFNILIVAVSLLVSIIHLIIFIPTNLVLSIVELRHRIVSCVTITNVLFIIIFVFAWVAFIKRGHETVCTSFPNDCDWIDGVLTWRGVLSISVITAVQVAINVFSVLLVSAFGSAKRRPPRADSVK